MLNDSELVRKDCDSSRTSSSLAQIGGSNLVRRELCYQQHDLRCSQSLSMKMLYIDDVCYGSPPM